MRIAFALSLLCFLVLTEVYSFAPRHYRQSVNRNNYLVAYGDNDFDNRGIFRFPDDEIVNDNTFTNLSENVNDTNDAYPSNDEILRQLINAYDNIPEIEVKMKLNKIMKSETDNAYAARQQMMLLVKEAEYIEREAAKENPEFTYESLSDAIRVVRSRLRMVTNGPEFAGDDSTKSFKWPWEKQ
jgi:hypothetical protein